MTEATRLPADLAGALALIETLKAQAVVQTAQNEVSWSAATNSILLRKRAEEELRNATSGWRRQFEALTREKDDAVAEAWRLVAVEDLAKRNETARREAVALWIKQAETARQMVADLAMCKELTFNAERLAADRLALLVGASEALESLIGVVDKVLWSHTTDAIINNAKDVLKQVKP